MKEAAREFDEQRLKYENFIKDGVLSFIRLSDYSLEEARLNEFRTRLEKLQREVLKFYACDFRMCVNIIGFMY